MIGKGMRYRVILAANEADMSIYRLCSHFRQSYRTIVYSPDGDYMFIPSSTDVHAVIREAGQQSKNGKKWKSKKACQLTDVRSLHGYLPF